MLRDRLYEALDAAIEHGDILLAQHIARAMSRLEDLDNAQFDNLSTQSCNGQTSHKPFTDG